MIRDFGYNPLMGSISCGSTGSNPIRPGQRKTEIANINLKSLSAVTNPSLGVSSVQICVRDQPESAPNMQYVPTPLDSARLRLIFDFATGATTINDVIVNGTTGAQVVLGSLDLVTVSADYVGTGIPGSIVAGPPKRVEVLATWGGSFSSKPVYYTDDVVAAPPGIAARPIPRMAQRVFLQSSDGATTATITLYTINPGVAPLAIGFPLVAAVNPTIDRPLAIVMGANFYRIDNLIGAGWVTPVFEIAL